MFRYTKVVFTFSIKDAFTQEIIEIIIFTYTINQKKQNDYDTINLLAYAPF